MQQAATPAPAARRRRRWPLLAAVLALVVLRRRRRRPRSERAAAPEPTVPAVEGRPASVEPLLHRPAAAPLPGRPRLAGVHGGSVPHAAVAGLTTELPLPAGRLVVGRDPGSDVRLDHPTVSPRHALLEVEPTGGCTSATSAR